MAIAGQIEYKVTVDTSGLDKGLNKAKGKASKFASALGTMGRTASKAFFGTIAIGAINASGAIAGIATSAVKSYAEYEQLVGGVETLFKKSADDVMNYANKAYETAGLSANQYMEQATAFSASLLQSLSGDTKKTAEITDMAIIDMADNANKMGTAIESIQNAYQGFAKQNYTMLDNLKLGYGGTKGEMERLLEDAEKLSGKKYDISNLNDVFEAIHVIQGELGITGTTAKEAGETISGSLGMMKTAWQNLVVGVADGTQDMDKLMGNFTKSVGTFAKNIMPVIKTALKGAVQLIKELAPQIIEVIPSLIQSLLPALIEATTGLLNAFVANIPALLQVLMDSLPMIIDAVMQIANGIIEALPQLLVILTQLVLGIAQGLVQPNNLKMILNAGVELLWGLIEAIPQMLDALVVALPDIISSIVTFLLDPENMLKIVEAGVAIFMGLVMAVPKILTSLLSAFAELFRTLWTKLTTMFSEFAGNFGAKIGGVFKNAINHVLAFIENFINAPIDIINGFVDTINGAFGAVGVNIGKLGHVSLGRMASGGIVPSSAGGRLILAGEGGQDEWVVPESKMASMVEQLTDRGVGNGSQGVTINVFGTFATSEAEQRRVAEQIYEKLKEINKARMGAYL